MDKTPGDATDPIDRLRGGHRAALAALFDQHRDRLRRMVELRPNARLRARLDASDVLQEAFLDLAHARKGDLAEARQWLEPLRASRPDSQASFWDLQEVALIRSEAESRLLDAGFPRDPIQGSKPR